MTTPYTDPATSWVDPTDDPGAANAAVQAALKSAQSDFPVIDHPADDLVDLPGGLILGERVHRTVKVRELTGADEEALAKAMQSSNPFHFIDTLIACGTVQIGDIPEHQTKDMLKRILIGDRDAIIVGIRRATYGESIEFENFICPECGGATNLDIPLDEIPVVSLEDPASELTFKVELRKNRAAMVRLPNGHDQTAIFEKDNITSAERDTILLSRCVQEIIDDKGESHSIMAFPSLVRDMGLVDRKKIIKEIVDRQPGPRLNEVKFTHNDCGEEVTLTISVGDLFPDI